MNSSVIASYLHGMRDAYLVNHVYNSKTVDARVRCTNLLTWVNSHKTDCECPLIANKLIDSNTFYRYFGEYSELMILTCDHRYFIFYILNLSTLRIVRPTVKQLIAFSVIYLIDFYEQTRTPKEILYRQFDRLILEFHKTSRIVTYNEMRRVIDIKVGELRKTGEFKNEIRILNGYRRSNRALKLIKKANVVF